MKLKLYTLQQCFEASGSKFPFKVYWHCETLRPQQEGIYTITSRNGSGNWLHKPNSTGVNCGEYFIDKFAKMKLFDYKIIEYGNDFDKLVNED